MGEDVVEEGFDEGDEGGGGEAEGEDDGGEGEGVVAKGGKGGGLFAPKVVGVLFADEAGEDAATEGGPFRGVEDFAAEEDCGGPEGVVVGELLRKRPM